jgi:Bacteriocin-protection, YdeI or OmpD-Associated/Domain of unknown function (DUF1905)
MPYFTHSFEGPVARFGVGKTRKVWYTVLFLPADVEGEREAIPPSRFRVEAEVNGFPASGAFIPAGDGRRYLLLSPELLKQAELKVGNVVEELSRRAALRKAWAILTPGRQRGAAHFVRTAKTPATRLRRVAEASEVILQHRGDFRKWQDAKKAGEGGKAPAARTSKRR